MCITKIAEADFIDLSGSSPWAWKLTLFLTAPGVVTDFFDFSSGLNNYIELKKSSRQVSISGETIKKIWFSVMLSFKISEAEWKVVGEFLGKSVDFHKKIRKRKNVKQNNLLRAFFIDRMINIEQQLAFLETFS